MSRLVAILFNILERAVGTPKSARCRYCDRLLTNPKSIAAGAGACCLRGRTRDDKTIDMFDNSGIPNG
jgi:hypothetical protein